MIYARHYSCIGLDDVSYSMFIIGLVYYSEDKLNELMFYADRNVKMKDEVRIHDHYDNCEI